MRDENRNSDRDLIEAFLRGEESAYVELVEKHSNRIYNLAYRYTKSREDAEEVMQDVFSIVYRKLKSFKGECAFTSWLYRVTVNSAFMKLRKRKKNRFVFIEDLNAKTVRRWACNRSGNEAGLKETYKREVRDLISKAILELPDEYRAPFVLKDVHGLTVNETAKALNLSVPAVKSRLHRARKIIQSIITHPLFGGSHEEIGDRDELCMS